MSNVQPTEPDLRITVIGQQRREFMSVMKAIADLEIAHRLFWYETVDEALDDGPDGVDDADLVVVFQSFSDQFRRSSVEALIGRTIFGRLLCCYGPWCESDGRNRNLWPDSVRVPLRLAAGMIRSEIGAIVDEADPLPPTAARDEIFTHRLYQSDSQRNSENVTDVNAIVVSPDRVFGETLRASLEELGIACQTLPLLEADSSLSRDQPTAKQVSLVLHDVDPWCGVVADSLSRVRHLWPSADVFGVATMPDAGIASELADESLRGVIPKLDLQLGLQHQLRHWFEEKAGVRSRHLKRLPA